ncbi:MAG: hypothetical protein V4733_11695 [Verrucomicrobiota bacterium]
MPRKIVDEPRARPAYFWWLLANGLALSFAVLSWAFCLHVFGNPEIPRNYRILKKLGRIPEMTRYTVLNVPDGDVIDPKLQYAKFVGLSDEDIDRLNSRLVRNYIKNFEQPLLLNYIEGDYQVEKVRKLGPGDFIPHGFAVRARALVKPDTVSKPAPFPVAIEYIYPTDDTAAMEEYRVGDLLQISKSPNCAVLVHVTKMTLDEEPVVYLSVVPIAYGSYRVGAKGRTFSIEPPQTVNPGAVFPVVK